jgi:hypothetical protein
MIEERDGCPANLGCYQSSAERDYNDWALQEKSF